MKYLLGENVQIDSFSDGECVVYDGSNEIMHILNQTAAMALEIILEYGESALPTFIQRNQELNQDIPIDILERDFENILKNFLKVRIVIPG